MEIITEELRQNFSALGLYIFGMDNVFVVRWILVYYAMFNNILKSQLRCQYSSNSKTQKSSDISKCLWVTKRASVEPLTYLDMRYIQVDITVSYEFQTLKKIEVRKYRIKKYEFSWRKVETFFHKGSTSLSNPSSSKCTFLHAFYTYHIGIVWNIHSECLWICCIISLAHLDSSKLNNIFTPYFISVS